MRSVLLFLAILPLLAFPAAAGDLSLTLVNPWTPLPAGWQVMLTDVGGGHRVDKACAADLNAMLSACRAAGFSPLICSSYRTQSTSDSLCACCDKCRYRNYIYIRYRTTCRIYITII